MLTQVGEVSAERWEERWEWLTGNGVGGYYVLCVLDGSRAEVDGEVENEERGEGEDGHRDEGVTVTKGEGRIVGTGALVVERKFIHDLGLVGHIEDIAVARDQQGKKLGLRIIQALDFVAERVGCYKVCPTLTRWYHVSFRDGAETTWEYGVGRVWLGFMDDI